MAKNKNRDRGKQSQPAGDRGTQAAKTHAPDLAAGQPESRITPSDMAQKARQRRFGHN